MEKTTIKPPPQHQFKQPGIESKMEPRPETIKPFYNASAKLDRKTAIITGGDSGIGRAVAYLFALEGANVLITYLDEHNDALETKKQIEQYGGKCELACGDLGDEKFCQKVATKCVAKLGGIDILVNNVAEQHPVKSLLEISSEQFEKTFKTNFFSYFYLTKASLKFLKEKSTIINTTSIVAYKGHPYLIDYTSTKGAIVSFTRSLSLSLSSKGIRVNAVAPGPVWTPLIPASFSEEHVAEFGGNVPMERAGQPSEIAPCYVFLASDDSSYMSGQVLHPNGGVIVNG